MDAVVVVALHGEGAFAFDGEVVFRVDAGARGVGFRFAVRVHVAMRLGAGARVGEGVFGAAFCDDENLACHLHVDGGVCVVGERKPAQVQVDPAIALGGVHADLRVAARVGSAEVVFARAGDDDLAAVHFDAAVVLRDGRAGGRVRDGGSVAVGSLVCCACGGAACRRNHARRGAAGR